MLTIHCWSWGLHVSVVSVLGETQLERTHSPFASVCQGGFLARVRSSYSFLLLSTGTPLWLDLCRPSEPCHSLCDFLCASVLFGLEDSFLGVLHPLCLFQSLLKIVSEFFIENRFLFLGCILITI